MICKMEVRKDLQTSFAVAECLSDEIWPKPRRWKLSGPGWSAEGHFHVASDALRATLLCCVAMGWQPTNPQERVRLTAEAAQAAC